MSGVLITGGSGRLGKELQALIPGASVPSRNAMDITDRESVQRVVSALCPAVIVHCAAYTNVAGAERERQACWKTNVQGTRNVSLAAAESGAFLVHLSTDYVFDGTAGMYKEEDPVGPVRNYYALSKLAAEEVARTTPRHLIIRTSFRPREWPYPSAFTDVFTSQDYVDVIAPQIALAVQRCSAIPYDTLHIATERKSVFELAQRRKPDVRPGSKREAGVELPDDISLDTSRWQELQAKWEGEQH